MFRAAVGRCVPSACGLPVLASRNRAVAAARRASVRRWPSV